MPVTELKCYNCKRIWNAKVPEKVLAKYAKFKESKPNFAQIAEANILGKCRRCGSGYVTANPMTAPAVIWHPTKSGVYLDPTLNPQEAEDMLFEAITDEPDFE